MGYLEKFMLTPSSIAVILGVKLIRLAGTKKEVFGIKIFPIQEQKYSTGFKHYQLGVFFFPYNLENIVMKSRNCCL